MAAKEIRRAKLRERMFGDRAFYAEMISVVVPIIIQNTVSNVVSLLDNVMVGRVGTLQMSAVAIVNQLLFVFNLCIFGGLAGAGIFATQYAGAHDHKGVRDCFRVKWMISLSMLACALAVFIALPKQLIGMYLAEETAQADAAATLGFGMDYLTVMLWGLLPFGVTQVYASTLREVGETRLPMLASVAAILVNLVFNYFLIFGRMGFPRLEVRFPGDGCNRRGDCDGAFPLYRNGDYRGLYAYPKGIFSLYSRRIPQSARSESPDERHFAPGHTAAGQRIFVVIRHGGAASVLFRARA